MMGSLIRFVRRKQWPHMGGLCCLEFGREGSHREVAVQLAIRPRAWLWGFECLYYDGPHMAFGLGPLLLISWEPWTRWGYKFAMRLAGMSDT